MTIPVDLTNLRSMTDGDVEMEQALFDEFYSSFELGIHSLQSHSAENTEKWRREAHALKGMALNLGAEKLGDLCKQAQEKCDEDVQTKCILLESLREEYAQVKKFLSMLS